MLLGGAALTHPVTHTITAVDVTAGSVTLGVTSGDLGADGIKSIAAQFSDVAGNTSTTTALSVVLDTTAPSGGTPDLAAASDSGASSADNITNVTAPAFAVALNPTVVVGDTVQLLLGGAALVHPVSHVITAVDVTAGRVTLAVTAGDLGVDGTKSISAQFSDAAGNTSTTSALNITLDTTTPTGGAPDLAAASDSGSSNADNITNVTAPSFTVALNPTVVAGDSVQLLLGGAALTHAITHTITAADVSAGSVTLAVTAGDLGADGAKSISTQFSDAAGNTSTTSALSITLDTTAPTGGAPDLVAASDSGSSNADNITNVTAPSFTVALNPTVVAGDSVQLLLGGAALTHAITHTINTTDVSAGSVTLSVIAGDLGSDGTKSITAQFSDTAGNISTTSALNVTLDTTAPVVAINGSGGSTNQVTQTISGTVDIADIGTTVTLFDNSSPTALGTATVGAGGVWSTSVTLVGNGTHSVVAQDTDAAGNTGSSPAIVFTLNTTAPSGGTPDLIAASDSGTSNDNITNVTAPTFTVALSPTALAGDTIQLLLGGSPLAHPATHMITATDVTAGSVNLAVTAGDLGADGTKLLAAQFSDSFGNTTTTAPLTLTLDTTAPSGGTPVLTAASDSGTSHTDGITDVTAPSFTVALNPTVAAGDTVQLLLGGSALAHPVTHIITAADKTAGNVTLTVTTGDLGADGVKSISAQFSDAAGNTSTTAALSVTLDITVPTGGTPDLVAASDSGTSNTDNVTDVTVPSLTVALNPTVVAGDGVQLLLGSAALAHPVTHTITATDVAAGSVTLSVTAGDLGADGLKSISAQFSDAAGNTSTTAALSITLDTTAPTGGTPDLVAASDSGTSNTDNVTNVTAPTFTVALGATAVAGDTIQLLLAGAALAHPVTHVITADDVIAGSVSLSVTAGDLGADGTKSITAQFSDTAGNTSTTSALSITLDTLAPAAPILALGTGVANGATAAEATAAGGVVTVTGEAGDSISVTFTNGTHTVTKTVTGTGSAQAVTLTSGDLTVLTDGTISVSATQTDAAGNAQTAAAATISFVLDTTAPAAPILALGTGVANGATAAEATAAGGVVTVTGEAGDSISVTFTNGLHTVIKTVTGTGSAQAVTLTPGDLTVLTDGTISVSATQTDAAGNAQTAAAATISFVLDTEWLNAVSGNWITAADWSAGVPVAGAFAALNATGASYTVTSSGAVSLAALSGSTAATLDIEGGTFTVTNFTAQGPVILAGGGSFNIGASNATIASLTESNSTLTGSGTLTVSGAASFTANTSTESGTGTTLLQSGASFLLSNGFQLNLSRTLELQGTSTVTSATGGTFELGITGVLKIDSGAIFNDESGTNGAGLNGLTINGSLGTVSNAGTWEKTIGTGTSVVNSLFNSTGTIGTHANVQIATGTLDLAGGGTDVFTSYSGAGTIDFGGGTRTLDANSSITTSQVQFNGGSTTVNGSYNAGTSTSLNGGSADLQVAAAALGALTLGTSGGTLNLEAAAATASSLTESGGTISGSGTLTVSGAASFTSNVSAENETGTTLLQSGASFLLGNAFQLNLSRTLELQGTSTVTSATGGTFELGTTGVLKIDSGAIFNDGSGTNGAGLNGLTINGSTGSVSNAGIWEKTGSVGTTTINALFGNTGTVEVQTGTLDIHNAATGAGAYQIGTVSNGATLEFDSSVAAGSTVTFEGSTGTLLLLQQPSFSTSNVIAGLSGSGDVLDLRGFASGTAVIHATTGAGSFNGTTTTLTVTDATHAATVQFTLQGNYSTSTWTVASDGHGGFDVASDQAPAISGDLSVVVVKGNGVQLVGINGAATADLLAVDPDSTPDQLTYTVVSTSLGHIANSANGSAITSFTQAQLNSGAVFFVADSPTQAAQGSQAFQGDFTVTLSDGIAPASAPTTVGVTLFDAQLTVQTTSGYNFNQDGSIEAMGGGLISNETATSFTITNANPTVDREFAVTGSGFLYDPSGALTAGTINSIVETMHDTHAPLATFTLNVSATAWMNAVTAAAGGDHSLIEALTNPWVFNFVGNDGGDSFETGDQNDIFTGNPGNDTFSGDSGYDRASYTSATAPINVQLAAGTVIGDASVGTDTLRSIELVSGSNFADTYNATGFSANSINAGSTVTANTAGTFNEFEGRGGDDIITGNGATRVSYFHATSGVTVTFDQNSWTSTTSGGSGTAVGDASVGTDTFTGVNSVRGSNFDDVFHGSNNPSLTAENFEGMGGNDLIDGGGGFSRAVYSSTFNFSSTGVGVGVDVELAAGTVTDRAGGTGIGAGTDTLISVEGVWGTDFADIYNASGFTTAFWRSAIRAPNPPAGSRSVARSAPSTNSKATAATIPLPATATPVSSTPMRPRAWW